MGRAPCCDKNGLKKGPWTPEEDLKLINYIQTHGPGNWRQLPKNAGLQRCGKSCRLRWTNYLRPDIKRGRFSFEEEETIIQLHSILGNKWSAIAARLPGRTDNEIKNYWNTHIRKRLLRNGIDPVTHAPRLDFLDLSSILSSAVYSQSLLQVSNLLGTQAGLMNNPDVLRLATTLMTLKQENPEMLLQYLQNNNQLPPVVLPPSNNYSISQTAGLDSLQQVPQQFQVSAAGPVNNGQELAASGSTTCAMPSTTTTSPHDDAPALINMNAQTSTSHQNELACSGFGTGSDPNYYYLNSGEFSPTALMCSLLSGNSNMGFDSVMSTPVSSSCSPTPLNSSSTFVNSSSTEDERESYSSSLLKFDIPQGLDISDFM